LYTQTEKASLSKKLEEVKQEVSVRPFINSNQDTNDDWKKILTTVDKKNQVVTSVVKTDSSSFDDTTLTAQMSKDVLSRYLMSKKGGKDLTQEDVANIANDVMTSPEYSKKGGVIYVSKNLHVISETDQATVKKYKTEVGSMLKKRKAEIAVDPTYIIGVAIAREDENMLKRLDPIILTGKSSVTDLLGVNVPSDAVQLHLKLINVSSALVADLENIRKLSTDPASALVGISQYTNNLQEFENSINNLDAYFKKKLGS
jgi:hypothetical protein